MAITYYLRDLLDTDLKTILTAKLLKVLHDLLDLLFIMIPTHVDKQNK